MKDTEANDCMSIYSFTVQFQTDVCFWYSF